MRRASKLWMLIEAGVILLVGFSVAKEIVARAASEQDATVAPGRTGRIWITAVEKGTPVSDLKKDDLRLFIGKQEETISSLTFNPPASLTLGLLIDVSGSRKDVLPNAEEKVAPALSQAVMRPGDKAFVMEVQGKAEVVTQPTSDLATLQHGLDAVSMQPKWGPTALYDGIWEASGIGSENAEQRRILVLVSDGDSNAGQHSVQEMGERLRNTRSLLEFVDLRPAHLRQFHSEHPQDLSLRLQDDAKRIDRLSETMGGIAYSVKDRSGMEKAFNAIAPIIRSQYALEFQPAVSSSGEKAENIEIKCARRGVKILAPQKY